MMMNLQPHTDAFLSRTLLPFMPHSVTPNAVSWLRIVLLPVILFLLARESYAVGLAIFALAALTDALDGAMARTRDQITERGKILDAAADRGLIGILAIIFIPKYFGWRLLIALALLEFGNAYAAYRSARRIGFNPGASGAGKIKMVLQCLAFFCIFARLIGASHGWITAALVLLLLSLVCTVFQIFAYPTSLKTAEGWR